MPSSLRAEFELPRSGSAVSTFLPRRACLPSRATGHTRSIHV